jgi:glycosyltransferase involved in cell wall biosynthesis
MKVLIVCSYRNYSPHTHYAAPFVYEQAQSLEKFGCEIRYLFVRGGGFRAYFRGTFDIMKTVNKWKPQIVHAHGGLCGTIANMQRKIPVVTTYHGSDINNFKTRFISRFAIRMSAYNLFVSQSLKEKAKPKRNFALIPCGVDINIFYPMDKNTCRKILGWEKEKKYILFSKEFTDPVKNSSLAFEAVKNIPNAELVELIGYTRKQVNELMNACDVMLMTSISEGSPQFIKEAMACKRPIVSTDVGDVKEMTKDIEGCYICSYEPDDVVNKLNQAFAFTNSSDEARKKIKKYYSLTTITQSILSIYEKMLNS